MQTQYLHLSPATQIQRLSNASKSLHFFPHCKACLSYVTAPETHKAQKTLNTSNKTFIDSFSDCKGEATQDIGATLHLSCSVFWNVANVVAFGVLYWRSVQRMLGRSLVCFGVVKYSVTCLVGFSGTFWICVPWWIVFTRQRHGWVKLFSSQSLDSQVMISSCTAACCLDMKLWYCVGENTTRTA